MRRTNWTTESWEFKDDIIANYPDLFAKREGQDLGKCNFDQIRDYPLSSLIITFCCKIIFVFEKGFLERKGNSEVIISCVIRSLEPLKQLKARYYHLHLRRSFALPSHLH